MEFFATAARGLEYPLSRELAGLGADETKERNGGVRFTGDLECAYRACLWSRLASRILMPLATVPLEGTDASQALYEGAAKVAWQEVFDAASSFAIEVAGRSPAIAHTHYAGLKVKDAIADVFRRHGGDRPSVDTKAADIRIHLHLHRGQATLSLDLAGESLHRRGYRHAGSAAPLRENLAAAILVRAGWPELARSGAPLVDPMCGSGTLLIEAALMAADVAPGLARRRYGFEAWLEHKPAQWRALRGEAEARAAAGRASRLPLLLGSDVDPAAIRVATANAGKAQLANAIRFEVKDLTNARPVGDRPGLVATNPPYGERLGDESLTIKLHSLLGDTLKQHFGGWQAAVFTGRPDLGKRIGLRAKEKYSLYNGALPCELLLFDIGRRAASEEADAKPEGGADFANRLSKNLKHLRKWARRRDVHNYRVYDADLTEYAVAVDLYQAGGEAHVHVQEYAAPRTVDPARAEKRLREALAHIRTAFDLPSERLHYKLRKAQKGASQYGKHADGGAFHETLEHGCRLLVNFDDYLDTGLFLDHRPLRHRIQQEARGKSFLNLFCYTASATAHAIVGGAERTTSVDLSNTYLEWARRNLGLNGARAEILDGRSAGGSRAAHRLLRADCLLWLEARAAGKDGERYDLVLCDPPTFSNSKRMEGVLDVQRDHALMVRRAAALLAPGGTLYFSTNRRGFKLDPDLAGEFELKDITAQTLDEDFKRPRPAHRCWEIRNRG